MASKGSRKRRGGDKKPHSPIALATSDYLGNTIVLSEESWLHARAKHGVTDDLEQVDKLIRTPMRFRRSTVNYHSNSYVCERISDTGIYLRAPIQYPEDADINTGSVVGRALTVYPEDAAIPSQVGEVIFESEDSTLPPIETKDEV